MALASKLLSRKFENLTAAINFALARKGTTNIENVISRQRACSESGETVALPNTGTEADISWALAADRKDREKRFSSETGH